MKKNIINVSDKAINLKDLKRIRRDLDIAVFTDEERDIRIFMDQDANLTESDIEYLMEIRSLNHTFPKGFVTKNGINVGYSTTHVDGNLNLEELKKQEFLRRFDRLYTDGAIIGKQGIMMNNLLLHNMVINDRINVVSYGAYVIEKDKDFTDANIRTINQFITTSLIEDSLLRYNKKAYKVRFLKLREELINNPDLVYYLDRQMKEEETIKEYAKRI